MKTNGWTYALAAYRTDGQPLGQAVMDIDWEPARQWARYVARCEGRSAPGDDGAEVAPLWHTRGEPMLRGFRVALRHADPHHGVACDFETGFFRPYAQALSSTYVATGQLSAGDTFRYVPLAIHAAVPATPPATRFSLQVEDVSPEPPLAETSLAEFAGRTEPVGEPLLGEIPVFAPFDVMAGVVDAASRAGAVESGGALAGHLRRDPLRRRVFVEITAQIPASLAEGSATTLRFTSDTWQQLRQAIERRGQGEQMVGWWHSHPVHAWCDGQSCGHDDPAQCAALADCFSEHDLALHRTVFPDACSVALVANVRGDHDVKLSVYGWHEGQLRRRGLQCLAR
jgi:hypothetical protein